MGAWITLHLALLHPDRIAGILGIAAAPDFVQDLYASSTTNQREEWKRNGVVYLPTQYDSDPYPFTWKLIKNAQAHWGLLDGTSIPIRCPVRLLHGQCDEDISWKKSLELTEKLEAEDVTLTLIKSGDHRLSRPQDLELIYLALDDLVALQDQPDTK
jgi:pimeloyl-ACP methyl ester carboxylesterase